MDRWFGGLIILLLLQTLGEGIQSYFSLSLPGPVIGMLLLFSILVIWRGIPKAVGDASQTLIRYLSLMFMPPAAGLFFLSHQLQEQWLAISGAIVLGTFVTLLLTGLLMKALIREEEHG